MSKKAPKARTSPKRIAASTKNAPTKPVEWSAVEYWLNWLEMYGREKNDRRVDLRLETIAPALEAVIRASVDGLPKDLPRQTQRGVIALATRALGTHSRWETRRSLVVCDWAVRCALPIWLDRLPRWCSDGSWAKDLRGSDPLLWTDQIVMTLSTLMPIWLYLPKAAVDRGTADERAAVRLASDAADMAMHALTGALRIALDDGHVRERGDQAWICRRALRIAQRPDHRPDADVKDTIPSLVDVLLAIRDADSQRSIADRCTWPRPRRSKVA